jgi:hypothetical protein
MIGGSFLWLACIGLALSPQAITVQTSSPVGQPDESATVERLRADIRTDRVAAVRREMQFNPDESAAFWPIYNDYAAEMSKANDDRVAIVREYADKYADLSDADAAALTQKMLAFEQRRLDIRRKYYKEFSGKLSGRTVAKFFQLEHRFDLVIDLQLAARLPAVLNGTTNP